MHNNQVIDSRQFRIRIHAVIAADATKYWFCYVRYSVVVLAQSSSAAVFIKFLLACCCSLLNYIKTHDRELSRNFHQHLLSLGEDTIVIVCEMDGLSLAQLCRVCLTLDLQEFLPSIAVAELMMRSGSLLSLHTFALSFFLLFYFP